jgi:hypothetical protein
MSDLTKRNDQASLLGRLDDQIAAARPEEKLKLLRVRAEIIAQNRADDEARRKGRLEALKTYHQIASPWLLIGIGSAYAYIGLYYLGYLLIGAGIFLLAPRFIELLFKHAMDRKEENDDKS